MANIGLTTQAEILEAFRNRVIDQAGDLFTVRNCYLDDDALPSGDNKPDWDYACSVSMSDGQFNQPDQIGGSRCMVVETADLSITPMVRYGGGEPRTLDHEFLVDPRAMVKKIKPLILRAIMIDGTGASKAIWEPKLNDGTHMLTESIRVVRAIGPRRHAAWPLLYLSLVFSVSWRWRL